MQVRNLFLFVGVFFVMLDVALAKKNELFGCWRVDRESVYFNNGSTQERKPNCLEFVDEKTIKRTCVDTLGVALPMISESYETRNPDTLEVMDYWFKKAKTIQYVVSENTLEKTQLKSDGDKSTFAPVKTVSRLARIKGSSLEQCLPKYIDVKNEDFSRYWRIRDYIINKFEYIIRFSIFEASFGPIASKGDFLKNSFSNEERLQAWREVKDISKEPLNALRKNIQKEGENFEQLFFDFKACGAAQDLRLASPIQQAWASDVMTEVIAGDQLLEYSSAINVLMGNEPGEDYRLLMNIPNDSFEPKWRELQRTATYSLPKISWLRPYFLEYQDLEKLEYLRLKNSAKAKEKGLSAPACLDHAFSITTASIGFNNMKYLYPQQEMKNALERAKILRRKLLEKR